MSTCSASEMSTCSASEMSTCSASEIARHGDRTSAVCVPRSYGQ